MNDPNDLKIEEQFLAGRDSEDDEINEALEQRKMGKLSTAKFSKGSRTETGLNASGSLGLSPSEAALRQQEHGEVETEEELGEMPKETRVEETVAKILGKAEEEDESEDEEAGGEKKLNSNGETDDEEALKAIAKEREF